MKKFAFTADWHLAPCAWKRNKLGVGDSYDALKFIVDYCVEHQLVLVAAGDLLDQTVQPDAKTVDVLCQNMSRMESAGLPVYYIQGQHEKSDPPWMSVHRWPKHVHASKLGNRFGTLAFDWQPRQVLKDVLAGVKDVKMLVMHQVWQEFVGFEHAYEASFSDIPDCVEYLLTGDHHKHSSEVYPRASGKPIRVLSPGSISAQELSEEWQKQFFVVEDHSFQSVTIPSRSIYRVRVTHSDQVSEVLNRIKKHKQHKIPILEVTVSPEFDNAFEYFDKFDKVHYELVLKYETSSQIETIIDRLKMPEVSEASDVDYLRAAVSETSDIYPMASRMLMSESPSLEIAEIKKEFFGETQERSAEECVPISRRLRRV